MQETGFTEQQLADELSFEAFRQTVISDYTIAFQSRQASLLGRKEVLTGKAKFGIFGDGKEVPQVAMAKFFKPGDFYAGYYRDQTFALATGAATLGQFFSQLYADPNPEHDPHSAGRQMNCHFCTPFIDEQDNFIDFTKTKNLSSGMAPTAGHLPRALGLAYASKIYRHAPVLENMTSFSNHGNEVCFCTIGDASTSEGHFWETMNAAAVTQVPLVVFVWDDGYGISVPKELQTVKASISDALSGFEKSRGTNGMLIYKVKGWDYAQLCEVFEEGITIARNEHIPVLFHVEELTQPQGHSTSGSHERYKSPDRLQWERQWDCLVQMRTWIIENGLASNDEIETLEDSSRIFVNECRLTNWKLYDSPIQEQKQKTLALVGDVVSRIGSDHLNAIYQELSDNSLPFRRDIMVALQRTILLAADKNLTAPILAYYQQLQEENKLLYNSKLYVDNALKPLPPALPLPSFSEDAGLINGYEILNRYFDELFEANPTVVAFGEDLGKIGDVNQGFAGLQAKYGVNRIFDTGIREQTIMGQAHGLAMRGLRPIAEIQYLDYLMFGIQTLSDDVATLHYRSVGRQSSPVIIRTRGHRLEGIFHSGSPMGMIVHALRGMFVCVPRNMVQAVGMYNTLLQGNDPALLIECLNGYRLKESVPSNINEFTVPLGMPEIIRAGEDITIVTYGSTLRIVEDAAIRLAAMGIDCEVIDVQTLLPFDINHQIVASLKKTNRILFVDEDVPGGATAYMYQQVIEIQGGYKWLDASARTLSAKAHRPAYASDGDYFSKPNTEEVIQVVKEMIAE